MPTHSTRGRGATSNGRGVIPGRRKDRAYVPTPEPDPTDRQTDVSRGVSVEEGFLPGVDELPKPDGAGDEVSTSNQSFEEVVSYSVSNGHYARLQEVSASVEDNGQVRISVNGVVFGEYSGAVDVDIPLDECILPPGYDITIVHQSTDGNTTTTQGQIVVAEV